MSMKAVEINPNKRSELLPMRSQRKATRGLASTSIGPAARYTKAIRGSKSFLVQVLFSSRDTIVTSDIYVSLIILKSVTDSKVDESVSPPAQNSPSVTVSKVDKPISSPVHVVFIWDDVDMISVEETSGGSFLWNIWWLGWWVLITPP